jgi:hypothetical protein
MVVVYTHNKISWHGSLQVAKAAAYFTCAISSGCIFLILFVQSDNVIKLSPLSFFFGGGRGL